VAGSHSLNLNSVNQLIFVMVKCGVLFEVQNYGKAKFGSETGTVAVWYQYSYQSQFPYQNTYNTKKLLLTLLKIPLMSSG
jgi:hypothetical protein